MKTILTGIRANSVLTLGNYLGALLPMVRLANKYSDEYQINIFVPDLHSIISDVDGDLQGNIIRTLKYWLAAGHLSPKLYPSAFRTMLDFELCSHHGRNLAHDAI